MNADGCWFAVQESFEIRYQQFSRFVPRIGVFRKTFFDSKTLILSSYEILFK